MANTMMVVGADGIIIVDTLDCIQSAQETLAAFRTITDKPVKTVIYTHYHQDHVSGAMAYLDAEQRGRTADVYGHEQLQANWVQSNGALGPITGARRLHVRTPPAGRRRGLPQRRARARLALRPD
jgi:glyoxylase-like metal-dependent hydrolase (beta-lactamase superfamily II)